MAPLFRTTQLRCKPERVAEEAKADIFDYIERLYNRTRSPSDLRYLSPVQYEKSDIRAYLNGPSCWGHTNWPIAAARKQLNIGAAV